ncbi:hypothetical protein [Caballeronia sp. 15711]|uniref:hypothetical protein n=1 Tax=Caballeronia sp. 15711 TaxID=3391029 RepID=UPI0039E4C5F6
MFISSEHLNKKRLAPDAARKRWLEHEQTEVAGYRRCRREKPSIVQGKEPWARQPGRQTEPRPHGSQEMSVSNRNCVSSFDFCPFTLAFGQRGERPGFASTWFLPLVVPLPIWQKRHRLRSITMQLDMNLRENTHVLID